MKNVLKVLFHIFVVVFLTILTQVGGVVYLMTIVLCRTIQRKFIAKKTIIFISLYLLVTYLLVPQIAPILGREPVEHRHNIQPTNYMTILLNRNYVRPALNQLLEQTAKKLDKHAIQINYLDANFPFINRFPLLPHLSHHDGKKIDLSFVYEDKEGNLSQAQKSFTGYGVFIGPKQGEQNQIQLCESKGYVQYSYPKYFRFMEINQGLRFSEKGTKKLVNTLLENKTLGKLFIEPHLKNRLGLINNRIRYQGCRSVRHDDHIHIQLK